MPTYNDCAYISESINSVLDQTFTNFEFIIVNDGSTDDTLSILQKYDDYRITIITHMENQGRPAARNTALYAASSEYCAWMDSDDICPSFRFEKQINFMDAHPDVIVSGGHSQVYETKVIHRKPLSDETIRIHMIWSSPFPVPTTIFRRVPCLQIGGFHKNFPVAEDYDFWRRLALLPGWRFANLDEVLMLWREHPHADRNFYHSLQSELGAAVIKAYLLDLGMPETELDIEAHMVLSGRSDPLSIPLKRAQAWVARLIQFNRKAKIFTPQLFNESCKQQLLSTYVKASWLPIELKRIIPFSVKNWIKKSIFTIKY
jgi:hypothetical protein